MTETKPATPVKLDANDVKPSARALRIRTELKAGTIKFKPE